MRKNTKFLDFFAHKNLRFKKTIKINISKLDILTLNNRL